MPMVEAMSNKGDEQHKPKKPLMSARMAMMVIPVGRPLGVLAVEGGGELGADVEGIGTGSAGSTGGVVSGTAGTFSDMISPVSLRDGLIIQSK